MNRGPAPCHDVPVLLGFNTNGLVHHRLDEGIRLLADEGFEAIALTPDVAHLDPYRTSPQETARIGRLLAQTGLLCVVETGARYLLDARRKHRPNLLEEDPAHREVRADFLKRCLRLAADLGAPILSLWAGALPAGVGPATGRERLRSGIEALLPSAGELGVQLALEPEPGMLVETVAEGLAVWRDMGEPEGLGLTVDIGHLFVTGEGSPAAVLPQAGSRVRQVHVEDIRGTVHEHLPPGAGDVDFPAVWAALESISYRGPVCFELSRSSHDAPDMLRLVKETFSSRKG